MTVEEWDAGICPFCFANFNIFKFQDMFNVDPKQSNDIRQVLPLG